MKNVKKIGVALCLAAASIVPVFASNTSDSTAGTVRADSDNYIDLNYFNEVQFNKAFAFTNFSETGFQLGTATRLKNDMYLGGFYSGDFWGDLSGLNNTKSDKEGTLYPNDSTQNSASEVNSKYIKSTSNWNYHNFDVLFGLKNMGFKLDTYLRFNTTLETLDRSKLASDKSESYPSEEPANQPYKDYSRKNFYDNYDLKLGWGGMSFATGKATSKPYAYIGVDIYNNADIKNYTEVNKDYDPASQKYITNKSINTSSNNNYDTRTNLNLKLGSEFVWGKGTSFMQVLDASNYFGINIYPTEKSVTTVNTVDTVTPSNNKTVTTTENHSGNVNFTDTIYTNYRFEYKPVENLTLGFRAGINTSMTYENPGLTTTNETTVAFDGDTQHTTVVESYDNGTGSNSTSKTTVDGVLVESSSYKSVDYANKTFTTTMNPSFGVGMSYAVKPNFVLNLGYSGTIPTITVTDNAVNTTETTTNKDLATKEITSITKTESKKRNVSVKTGGYGSSLSTGFVWGLGKYCALDVNVNVMKSDRAPSFNDMWTAGWDLGFSFKM